MFAVLVFFKQKTAYEMRISDWSSDVCSSDLGARQNNLKNLDLTLATGELVVITGVSGSGKSSLAFDTLYAEGQRRYVETFSPYARQFLDQIGRASCRERVCQYV